MKNLFKGMIVIALLSTFSQAEWFNNATIQEVKMASDGRTFIKINKDGGGVKTLPATGTEEQIKVIITIALTALTTNSKVSVNSVSAGWNSLMIVAN